MVRTSVTHSAIASCATFLFLPHFDVICDLLLNRRTATWNLFVKYHARGSCGMGEPTSSPLLFQLTVILLFEIIAKFVSLGLRLDSSSLRS